MGQEKWESPTSLKDVQPRFLMINGVVINLSLVRYAVRAGDRLTFFFLEGDDRKHTVEGDEAQA